MLGFARVETVEVREERWELLREAKWSLSQWERHRDPMDLARLLTALEALRLLMQASA